MNDAVNLVPESFQRRLLLRRRLRQWGAVWLLLVVATVCVGGAEYVRLRSLRAQHARLEEQCAPLRAAERATQAIQAQLAALVEREALLAQLPAGDPPVRFLGIVGRAAYDGKHSIHIGDFELTTAGQGFGEGLRQLHLTGIGLNDAAVAKFVADLQATNCFRRVTLKSNANVAGLAAETCQFEVTCERP